MVSDEGQLGFSLEGMEAASKPVASRFVRIELEALLETAKAARDTSPWDIETLRHYRAEFPEKAKRLPPDEAEFLRRQFVLELQRIELLLAA